MQLIGHIRLDENQKENQKIIRTRIIMPKNALSQAFAIISNPHGEFGQLKGRTLDSVLIDYFKLLALLGIAVYVSNLAIYNGRAAYYGIFRGIDVSLWRMLNYSMGNSTSLIFFYLFSGTFLAFIILSAAYPFIHGIGFVQYLKVWCYSLSPVLLFGWIIPLLPGLFLWALVLLVSGIRQQISSHGIHKDSIDNRD